MDIDYELRRWAAWSREHNSLRVKPLAMFDDGTRAATAIIPMNDDEGLAFDPGVATLRQIDKELYNYVRLHYLYGMSTRAIARMQGRSQTGVITGLSLARTFIGGFVCGRLHTEAKFLLSEQRT